MKTWSIADVADGVFATVYRVVGTVLRPLDDRAAQMLFDAADMLAESEAERDAWEENELRDRAPWERELIRDPFEVRYETSVDPVECSPVGHADTPGEEGPSVAAASQRATEGQPTTTGDPEWDAFLRRLVREEIDRALTELLNETT